MHVSNTTQAFETRQNSWCSAWIGARASFPLLSQSPSTWRVCCGHPAWPCHGTVTSPLRFRYRTIEFGDVDIHVRTLRDTQQFRELGPLEDDFGISPASWSLFGVIWESGEALAQLMVDFDIDGCRILEVGCGIALASLVLRNRSADITATDRHPDVGEFLRINEALNGPGNVDFVRADWADEASGLGTFDVIIGADLLYEPDHTDELAAFIDRHANPTCEVIIVDPGRGQLAAFGKRMVTLGYSDGRYPPADTPSGTDAFHPRFGHYVRSAS